MISQVNNHMFMLRNMTNRQNKLSYQLSSKNQLEYGSDNSRLFGNINRLTDKLATQKGISEEIKNTQVLDKNADAAIAEIKKILDSIKEQLIKANTSSTTEKDLDIISKTIQGYEDRLLALGNSKVDDQYIFGGSDTSVVPFTKDANGKIVYNGNNDLRKILTDDSGSDQDAGVNGIELFYYSTDSAQQGDTLTFKSDDKIIDQNGKEWTLDTTTNTISRTKGDGSTESLSVSLNSDGTYALPVPSGDGNRFEAKRSIFNLLDSAIKSTGGLDDAGNKVLTYDERRQGISSSQDELKKAAEGVSIAHTDLGVRNKKLIDTLASSQAKVTQYQSIYDEIAQADQTDVALQIKSLESMFAALYSTISKIDQLSLLNYMK